MNKKVFNEQSVILLLVNILIGSFLFYCAEIHSFKNPNYFYFLLLIPLLSAYYVWRNHKVHPKVQLSSLSLVMKKKNPFWKMINPLFFSLYLLGLASIIIALARPQSEMGWQNVETEGIDLVIATDVSASMLAMDFSPNRLEASKKVAIDFIKKRPNDRIGLVVYEGESFTQCPLTTDHRVLINMFKGVKTGLLAGGTAIGMGIGTAVARLKDSKAKSKVIILLTDGVNNQGSISPNTAANLAKDFGIRIYTIGIGTNGMAKSPVGILPDGSYHYDYVKVEIDEASLRHIAQITDGKYFRATNEKKLESIYAEIDKLEKTKIKVTEHSRKQEEFLPFALAGLGLIFLGVFVKDIIIKGL